MQPEKWDGVSRGWQQRRYVQDVCLVILDGELFYRQCFVSICRFIFSSFRNSCVLTMLHNAFRDSSTR